MSISIVVPVYNKIELVERCLALNLNNCTVPQEWIIIDNASDAVTKAGLLRLKTLAENAGHQWYIHTEKVNTGVAKAWNTGLNQSKGAYVCILNNDCVLMPGWDVALPLALEQFNLDLCSPFIVESWMFRGKSYTLENFLSGPMDWKFLLGRNKNRMRPGTFGGVVFFGKKSVYEAIGPFDEQFWLSLEEYDYLQRAYLQKFKTGMVGSCVAFHFAGLTRREMKTDGGTANQQYFAEKWGWHFEQTEAAFPNKQIKSWQKFLFRWFYFMSILNLKWPYEK